MGVGSALRWEDVLAGSHACGCCPSVATVKCRGSRGAFWQLGAGLHRSWFLLFARAVMFGSTVRGGCAEAAGENLVPTSSVPTTMAFSDVISFLKALSCSLVASFLSWSRSTSESSILVLGTGQRRHF
ncbi:hypothetical protein BRADI_4g21521v3 [Brachypodium distachyon]|uniref:Uncharacterized protein n=1 Tax=Brachypodium distachyon TaxID=15368 RepID=A0A2K2CP79_BRADI|nr:hypothetical protein BRADI_4g21521v3 [Brachypodium distachyon]